MDSLLSHENLDRLSAVMAGVAGTAGLFVGGPIGLVGGLAAATGILGVACSGQAILKQRLSDKSLSAAAEIDEFSRLVRTSWQSWSRQSDNQGRSAADLEAASEVFNAYFSSMDESRLPSPENLLKAKLTPATVANDMLLIASEVAPEDYGNALDLNWNRKFFCDVIEGAYDSLIKRPGFTEHLQPALMRLVVEIKDDTTAIRKSTATIESDVADVKLSLVRSLETVNTMLQSELFKNDALNQENLELKDLVNKAVEDVAIEGEFLALPDQRKIALEALANGQTNLAEQLFEDLAQKQLSSAFEHENSNIEARKNAAEALRSLGALAFLHDRNKAIQSFERAVGAWPDDIKSWNQLGQLYARVGAIDESERAFQCVEALASVSTNLLDWQATAYGNLGIVYKIGGDLDLAVEMCEKSLEIHSALGGKDGMAKSYYNFASVYQKRGEFNLAIEMLEKSLQINEELGRRESMARDYGCLGNAYQSRGELDLAVEMYEKSLEIDEALGCKEGIAICSLNLGSAYQRRGDLELAVEIYEKSLEINKELGRKDGIAKVYGNLGNVYQTRGELELAVEMYEKSLEFYKESNCKEDMATSYANLGNVYKMRGEVELAVGVYENSLEINKWLGHKEGMASGYKNLGIVYAVGGELGRALDNLRLALSLFNDLRSPTASTVQKWISEIDTK